MGARKTLGGAVQLVAVVDPTTHKIQPGAVLPVINVGTPNLAPTDLESVGFNITIGTPATHTEGTIYWDNVAKTISIQSDVEDVVLQVGQESWVEVYNNSGLQIDNGQVVYVTGASGAMATVSLAIANTLTTAHAIGVATHDIENGAAGYVTTFGLVRDVDTSAFPVGSEVFLSSSSAGGLTLTEPLAPNFSVRVGWILVSNVDTGVMLVNLLSEASPAQTITFTLPLRGVVDNRINITGELRDVSTGETGDYVTDFALSNNHLYLLINSLTGSGDVTITGTSLSESTAVPVGGDTETITVDAAGVYYQSAKKWWEITNIDIPVGISAIDYDVGVVGYTDINNQNFRLIGYRVDAFAQGVSPDFRFRIIKIQDDGSKQMSIVDIEDIGVDSGSAGDQIIDGIRTGGDDRSYNPAVAELFGNNTTLVFKQSDFNTYFVADENLFRSGTHDEGLILRVEGSPSGGISNVDFITIQLRYRPL